MKKLILIATSLIFIIGSGNYAPTSPDPYYIPPVESASPKKQKELESFFYGMNRKGVTINKVKSQKKGFELAGSFKKKRNFDFFVERIKKHSKAEESIKVKLWKTHFAGKPTNHYKISGKNSW